MKKIWVKLFILCLPFSQGIVGMDFQALRDQLYEKFSDIIPAANNPPKQISTTLSKDAFTAAVKENNIAVVKHCLNDKQFKDKMDLNTLSSAYTVAKENPSSNLHRGIFVALLKWFPHHFKTITKEEEINFLATFDTNDLNKINKFLGDEDFLNKTPLYVLRSAQSKARNYKDVSNKIRIIIQQKKYWMMSER